jgi:hypothetical protein
MLTGRFECRPFDNIVSVSLVLITSLVDGLYGTTGTNPLNKHVAHSCVPALDLLKQRMSRGTINARAEWILSVDFVQVMPGDGFAISNCQEPEVGHALRNIEQVFVHP